MTETKPTIGALVSQYKDYLVGAAIGGAVVLIGSKIIGGKKNGQ